MCLTRASIGFPSISLPHSSPRDCKEQRLDALLTDMTPRLTLEVSYRYLPLYLTEPEKQP